MITYKYYIDKHDNNGLIELKTKPVQGHSDVKILNEELDNGAMTFIIKNNEPLPIMSYIIYEVNDGEDTLVREFCVSNDDVTRDIKNKKYYQHNIELVELTKIFEKQYTGTLCFTPSNEKGVTRYYLSDCILRILRVFETVNDIEKADVYENINYIKSNEYLKLRYQLIDSNLFNKLKTIPAPQLVFNNPTLREALDGVLKYANAVCRLTLKLEKENGKVSYKNVVSADFLGKKQNKIYMNDIYKENSFQNIEQYSTNTVSFIKNSTSEEKYDNFNLIQYPKPYIYDFDKERYHKENYLNNIQWNDVLIFARVKSQSNYYNITDSNYGIVTQNQIQSVINVQIPIKLIYDSSYIQFTDEDLEVTSTGRKLNIILDVTENVIEEEEYINLTNEQKNNYFYYKKGSNFISFGGSFKGIIFETPAIQNVVVKALERFANKYALGKPNDLPITTSATIIISSAEEYNLISEFSIEWKYENSKYGIKSAKLIPLNNITKALYRISYVPLINCIISSEKINTDYCYLESENLINQENRVLSFSNFLNTTFSITQRNGNKTKEAVCKHYKIKDLINVGDYTEDNYICTQAEYIYYNNYIIGKYSFDSDYNRISSFMGINSDVRQYEIPNSKDSYERNILVKSYCEVSYSDNIEKCETIGTPLVSYIKRTLGMLDVYNYGILETLPIKYALISYNWNYIDNASIFMDYTLKDVNDTIMLECFTSGGPNVLNFNFGFNDNISAGEVIREESVITGVTYKLLKQQIPYACPYNEYNKIKSGTLRNLFFELTDGRDVTYNAINLPMVYKNKENFTGAIRTKDLLILKDPAEILNFTYQLHFLPKDNRVVLGNAFFENNYVHHNIIDYTENDNYTVLGQPTNYAFFSSHNRKFYVYLSKEEYSNLDIVNIKNKNELVLVKTYTAGTISDNKIFTLNQSQNNILDFSIKLKKELLQNKISDETKTIILADEYDNIIMHIAYDPNDVDENGENYLYKPIYFNFKDRRSDIKYEY